MGVAGGDEDDIGVVVTIVAEGSLRDLVPLSSLTFIAGEEGPGPVCEVGSTQERKGRGGGRARLPRLHSSS